MWITVIYLCMTKQLQSEMDHIFQSVSKEGLEKWAEFTRLSRLLNQKTILAYSGDEDAQFIILVLCTFSFFVNQNNNYSIWTCKLKHSCNTTYDSIFYSVIALAFFFVLSSYCQTPEQCLITILQVCVLILYYRWSMPIWTLCNNHNWYLEWLPL